MSHRTVRPPSQKERHQLEAMTEQAVGRVAMRAHMILLSARGYSAYEIAEIHQVTDPTVYKWIERFDKEGPEGLYDREREGRPPKLDEEAEAELERLLKAPPTKAGYDFTRWTAPRLAEHLKRKLGVDVHPETVREALRRLEFSWKRPLGSVRGAACPTTQITSNALPTLTRPLPRPPRRPPFCSKTRPSFDVSRR